VYKEDFTPIVLRGLMVELGWRMVDFVAARVQGKIAFQVSIPLLDPLAGYDSPNYETWAAAAPGAPCPPSNLLTAVVLCVWAVFKATGPPTQANAYAMMSVHHKSPSLSQRDAETTKVSLGGRDIATPTGRSSSC
jgi:hypothetical protein